MIPAVRRMLLHRLHLTIGAVLCLPLIVLGITGCVLVFRHEIDDLLDPTPHATAAGPSRPVSEIVAAAGAAAPGGAQPFMYTPPQSLGDAAEVRLRIRADGPPLAGTVRMFIDPASLEVLGARDGTESFTRKVELLHANLLIRDRSGRSAVGWLGVAMLALGISGLILWWPRGGRWRAAFRIQTSARGVVLLREVHRTIGFWSLIVFLVMSFSGVFIVFPETITAAVQAVTPVRDLRPNAGLPEIKPPAGRSAIDIDGVIAAAAAAAPGDRLHFVMWPQRPTQPLRAVFARADAGDGAPATTVLMDPWSRQVLDVRDPRSYSAAETALAWQRPLHAGDGLGWVWRVLAFLSGFLPPLFAITGVTMWLMKRRARRLALRRRDAVATGD